VSFSQSTGLGVVDVAGNKYSSVIIGTQEWMSANLNVDKFRNGDPIPEAQTQEEWMNAAKNKQPAWCYLYQESQNGGKFGKLYNYFAVSDPRGLAPEGWSIPSKEDWLNLLKITGISYNEFERYDVYQSQSNDIKKLMSSEGWADQKNGSNSTGFTIDPSGSRFENHWTSAENTFAWFWSSTMINSDRAWTICFNKSPSLQIEGINLNGSGFSVRCVKGKYGQVNERISSNSQFNNDYAQIKPQYEEYIKLKANVNQDSSVIASYFSNNQQRDHALKNYKTLRNSKLFNINQEDLEFLVKKNDSLVMSELSPILNKLVLVVDDVNDPNFCYLFIPEGNFLIKRIQIDDKQFKKLYKKELEEITVYASNTVAKIKELTNLDSRYFDLEKSLTENTRRLNEIKKTYVSDLKNGCFYFGPTTNAIRSGFGILSDKDNNLLFVGYWISDKPQLKNGRTYHYENNQTIEYLQGFDWSFRSTPTGDVICGSKDQGSGIKISTSGILFEGALRNNQMNGSGKSTHQGNSYEGNYDSDLRSGQGKMVYKNGDVYSGNWYRDKKSGFGTMTYKNGNVYTGEWSDDKKSGKGKLVYANGTIQEGDFENDSYIEPYVSPAIVLSDNQNSNSGQTSSYSFNSSQETSSCSYQFSIPKNLKFNYVDNREMCCYCGQRYAKYTNNDISYDKKQETVIYIGELLNLHFKSINASEEHKNEDIKRLCRFIGENYNDYYEAQFLCASAGGLFKMEEILGGIPIISSPNTTREIDSYRVEKFCSTKCEDECTYSRNCRCK
jgi:uncharacterized protein (TIGR02145 family)